MTRAALPPVSVPADCCAVPAGGGAIAMLVNQRKDAGNVTRGSTSVAVTTQ
jgi:hypothetical protein